MTLWDVAVLGAGPAGAIAATLLARRGAKVILLNKPKPSAQRIGETLPAFAADLLQRYDLPGPLSKPGHKTIGGVVSLWGGMQTGEDALARPGGPDWRLDRERFDEDLRAGARQAGAQFRETKVLHVQHGQKGWHLDVDQGQPLSAKWVIDATGRRGLVSRTHGGQVERQASQVAVWALRAPNAQAENLTSKTLIESQKLGWWYGAVLPCGSCLVAFHTTTDFSLAIRRQPLLWRQLLQESHLLSARFGEHGFDVQSLKFTDASGLFCPAPAGAHWVACGDAAMAFDPLSSQGLLNAIRTGIAAADVASGKTDAISYTREMHQVWAAYKHRHEVFKARLELSKAA